MSRLGFYGGSFDPPHLGHLAIARAVTEQFSLDEFVFIPAFHAPHKVRLKPTPPIDRYAMLCLATNEDPQITVSRIEIEAPHRPYSVETLTRLNEELADDDLFFVIGADSWMDITTWREWERVLTLANIIVVTRPGVEIGFDQVTDEIRSRIVDIRGSLTVPDHRDRKIYFTDIVQIDVSATDIRRKVREGDGSWQDNVPAEVAKYVEKYQIYT